MKTQRFSIVLATDDDVSERELCEVLDALGYHGVAVADQALTDHEHPCPSRYCIEKLRREGHVISGGADCCYCWVIG